MTVWDKGLGPPYINTSWLDEGERERELFLNKLIYNPEGYLCWHPEDLLGRDVFIICGHHEHLLADRLGG